MSRIRYVAKAVPGQGWRIWNRKTQHWWGEFSRDYPEALLAELNGKKNPGRLEQLLRRARTVRQNP